MQPNLSVLICTHNRPDDIERCVLALAPQMVDGVELIVVDSASEPAAAARLAAFAAEHPIIQAIRLDAPGVSIARNAAALRSRGAWLAILDDDAVPDPNWVSEVLALLQRLPPRAGVVGLYTRPIWPDGAAPDLPPLWIKYLSLVEIEREEDRTDEPVVVGANMLLRREVWAEVGGFPSRLSRVGNSLFSGDDSYVVERARRAGWSIWYSDRPRAGHTVPARRLSPAWFRERMFWEGVTEVKLRLELGDHTPLLWFARALTLAPVLGLLGLLEGARGTRWPRAMWHVGLMCAPFIAGQSLPTEIVAPLID